MALMFRNPMRASLIFFLSLLLWWATACQSTGERGGATVTHRNALAESSSPYLLQHAHNPVNWQPWGEAALEQAQADDQLVIVSVGYAACHWCHVMEKESFEDTAVARLMNEHFVSIKVDREQRPDVDRIYMHAAMMTSQRSGWPLNAIALPDGRPVFAATYLPKDRWMDLLQQFVQLYQEQPQQLERMAAQVAEGIQQFEYAELNPAEPDFRRSQLDSAVETLMAEMDLEMGGLRGAPKFPLPLVQELLLRYHKLTGKKAPMQAVKTTLDRMANGGIYDHLGGGFARYAVDSLWHVPHFEKMLYDNAMLVSLYAHAYQATGKAAYRRVIEESLAFIEREMTDSLGGFYSSLDADSEGEEGRFYAWTEKAITKAVGMEAALFKDYYGVSPFGNWEERRAGQLNILHITDPAAEVASRYGLSTEAFLSKIESAKAKLFEKRSQRQRPSLDDKVLTEWNAMMLRAYTDAYRALGDPAYLAAAKRNAAFLQENLYRPSGGLCRSWRHGKAQIEGFATDYAWLIYAYLGLYEATFETAWLDQADELMQYTLEHFFDESTGLFYFTSRKADSVIARSREVMDNVLPAANSQLARDLFYLGQYLYQKDYQQKARQMLNNVAINLSIGGVPTSNWNILLSHYVYPFYEVALVGEEWDSVRSELDRRYLPNALLLGGAEAGNMTLLQDKLVPGQTMIYVCQDKTCQRPTTDWSTALRQMTGTTPGGS